MTKSTGLPSRHNSVLLIDDNELDNFINQKVMEAHHFAETFYKALNGREAIDLLQALGPQNKFPAAIFVDLNMPVMDGFQVLEYLTSDTSALSDDTLLVVLTSSENESDKERAFSIAPRVRFLNKPLTASDLAQLM